MLGATRIRVSGLKKLGNGLRAVKSATQRSGYGAGQAGTIGRCLGKSRFLWIGRFTGATQKRLLMRDGRKRTCRRRPNGTGQLWAQPRNTSGRTRGDRNLRPVRSATSIFIAGIRFR